MECASPRWLIHSTAVPLSKSQSVMSKYPSLFFHTFIFLLFPQLLVVFNIQTNIHGLY